MRKIARLSMITTIHTPPSVRYYAACSRAPLNKPTARDVPPTDVWQWLVAGYPQRLPVKPCWWRCGYVAIDAQIHPMAYLPVDNKRKDIRSILAITRLPGKKIGPLLPGVELLLTDDALEWWLRIAMLSYRGD